MMEISPFGALPQPGDIHIIKGHRYRIGAVVQSGPGEYAWEMIPLDQEDRDGGDPAETQIPASWVGETDDSQDQRQ